jgi:hypothetical protein
MWCSKDTFLIIIIIIIIISCKQYYNNKCCSNDNSTALAEYNSTTRSYTGIVTLIPYCHGLVSTAIVLVLFAARWELGSNPETVALTDQKDFYLL